MGRSLCSWTQGSHEDIKVCGVGRMDSMALLVPPIPHKHYSGCVKNQKLVKNQKSKEKLVKNQKRTVEFKLCI